jgi:fructose-1,6-bisphosphatase/inositol monophosphatase family enzyme
MEQLFETICNLHDEIRGRVVRACERQDMDTLTEKQRNRQGDSTYEVGTIGEELLVEYLQEFARKEPLIFTAEGVTETSHVLPEGTAPEDARWRVIVDPIDGTNSLAYQKRPGWILTAIAPNRGDDIRLKDVQWAVQTEIPLVKQHLCDQLWAERGSGVKGWRFDRVSGRQQRLHPRPSGAQTIGGGCIMTNRFFPGMRDILIAIEEETIQKSLGSSAAQQYPCFEDHYASTAGQLYELLIGHDRFNGDLRALVDDQAKDRGLAHRFSCQAYDLATALIAAESGVILTDPSGNPLDASFDAISEVSWVGYANEALRAEIEPTLQGVLSSRDLL